MATNDENAIEEIMKPDNTPKLNTLDLKAYASLNDPSLQACFDKNHRFIAFKAKRLSTFAYITALRMVTCDVHL